MGNICTSFSYSSASEPHRDEVELVSTRDSIDATERETGSARKTSVSKTLDCSNLEDIKSRFAVLLTSVKAALEANHVTAGDVRSVLVGMCTGSDDYIPNTQSLDEIFRAATRHELWNYWHHSPVEKLLCRFLPDHISLIREYKEHLSGYCTTTKLINYIQDHKIDTEEGDNELPLASYTRKQCQRLTVTLDIKRKITTLSLKYVQDLWERFAEEFNIPFLTAVLDNVLSGSLIVTWLVPHDVAEKIVASAHKSTSFFQEHDIISVTIDIYSVKTESHITLREQFSALKAKEEEHKRRLDKEIILQKKLQEEVNSKLEDLEHKLAHLERRTERKTTALLQTSEVSKQDQPGNTPKLDDAFRELRPLAPQWETIGVLLDIPHQVLQRIKSEELNTPNHFREMLSQWLKQTHPQPTWKKLADAVEVFDAAKAQQIRRLHSN